MNAAEFTESEIQVIKESLKYYKQKINDYKDYPDYEFKQKQLNHLDALLAKL